MPSDTLTLIPEVDMPEPMAVTAGRVGMPEPMAVTDMVDMITTPELQATLDFEKPLGLQLKERRAEL
jgi:hypothetical protein